MSYPTSPYGEAEARTMIDQMKAKIDTMSREEMAWQWRFASVGSSLFQGDTGEYFEKRFKELGGWSSELSKEIGWDGP